MARGDAPPKAPNLFESSTISGIPQIVRAKGKSRWIKVGVFSTFVLGFLSQSSFFIEAYFKYPVSLSVQIDYPDGIMMPAMTICTGYRLNRKRYCHLNNDHCEEINDTLVVKEEYRKADINPTFEEMKKYGYTWEDVAFYNGLPWDNNRLIFNQNNPYRIQVPDDHGKAAECFVINQQTFSINRSATLFPTKSGNLFFQSFTANMYMIDHNELRFKEDLFIRHIAVHSPYVLVNPYKEGVRISPKIMIYTLFAMAETRLLPSPYRTDCMDYVALWEKDNTKPLSRSTCIQKCIYDKVAEACGCFPLGVTYPSSHEFCGRDNADCVDNVDIDSCYSQCKQDCVSYTYEYSMETRPYEYRVSLALRIETITKSAQNSENMTGVFDVYGLSFTLSKKEKVIYKYEPRHQIIEFFSYIGGLIGIWLGISLFDILDFCGICYSAFRAKKK